MSQLRAPTIHIPSKRDSAGEVSSRHAWNQEPRRTEGISFGPQALSAEQLAKMQKRTFDQLEGEVLAGVAAFSSPNHPGHQGMRSY